VTGKKVVMIEAFSTPRNRIVAILLLGICGLLAFTAAAMGVDDNPPGILLAFLAGAAFVLAFVHPWRTARKFLFFLLASVIGFILFVILSIILDSINQNPTTSSAVQSLLQSPITNVINIIIIMLCAAAPVVGIVGSVVMFIRSRLQQRSKS